MRVSTPIFLPTIWLSWIAATLPLATPAVHAQPAPANATPTVRFQRFVINDDPTYTGMEVSRGVIPVGWKLQGGVVWDLRDGRPAQFRVHVGDPNDIAAFDVYPNRFFYWKNDPQARNAAPGSRYMGEIIQAPPADQFAALSQIVIPRERPDLANAKVVEQEKLPKVAETVFNAVAINPKYEYRVMAGRIRLEYDLRGQTVQEDMYVVYTTALNLRLHFMNWSVENVTSTRGPKGTLDQLNTIRALMSGAGQLNIAWYNKVTEFVLMRQKATMQQLANQEQRRQIFMHMQNEISEERKHAFEAHMHDIDRRSDSFGDYMREVSPWKTSDGGSVKLPNAYGHAWEGANGEIIMNNDPLYNPNTDPNTHTNWTPMQQMGR